MRTPEETAVYMVNHYSTLKKAYEMAGLHGKDYPEGHANRKYWEDVERHISMIMKDRADWKNSNTL